MKQIDRRLAAVLTAAGCSAVLGAVALPATAQAATLRFFSQSTGQQFLGPDGQPLMDPSTIGPGAQFSGADRDYVGNHKRHANDWTASDHIDCAFTTQTVATCNAQLAIGGSMLLATRVNVTFDFMGNAPTVVPINGGTGKYVHARGTVTSAGVGNSNNSDLTVRVRT